MHELSLINALIDTVVQSAGENGITKVTKVKLVVGESHGALPEALQFAFEVLTGGTLCAGAELAIENSALLFKCRECGREFRPEGYLYRCPSCGVSNAVLVKGSELYVEYYEGD